MVHRVGNLVSVKSTLPGWRVVCASYDATGLHNLKSGDTGIVIEDINGNGGLVLFNDELWVVFPAEVQVI